MKLAPMFQAAPGVVTKADCASSTPRATATVALDDDSSTSTTPEPVTQAGAGIRSAVAGMLPPSCSPFRTVRIEDVLLDDEGPVGR